MDLLKQFPFLAIVVESDFDEPSYHTDENNHMFLDTAYL